MIPNREDIIVEAIHKCMCELYRWAQPSIDFSKYYEGTLNISDTKDSPFYSRYYISQENMDYIIDRFKEAYSIGSEWKDHIDLLLDYITNKDSVRQIYVKGDKEHPGYREYEKIVPLDKVVTNPEDVIKLINTCKDFYSRDFELSQFNIPIYLGCSPSSNKEEVEKYWNNEGIDFTIKDYKIEDILYPRDENAPTEEEFIDTLKIKE